jgi:beta-glucosidase
MVKHGYVRDNAEAAELAINAGTDMDMESRSYIDNLSALVKGEKVSIQRIDDAVRRILRKKYELGLFDDPFRFNNAARERKTLNHPSHLEASRDMARKSMVLLKNDGNILPLSKNLKSIALIGPLIKAEKDMKGFWSVDLEQKNDVVSLYSGMQKQADKTKLLFAQGCAINDTSTAGFAEALKIASEADVIVMAMGETYDMTGEAKSKANIHLPGVQEDLIRSMMATGKPVVVLLMSGRPMVFSWTASNVPAILYTWWLGSQAGNAIADVLYGVYNPSGKLPMTIPRSEGQIPIYYNYLNTGRPATGENDLFYRSSYIDLPNSPQYAFGHGLSYTSFQYSNLKLSQGSMNRESTVTVSFDLQNTGKYAGEEVVQLYIRDLVSQPVRPVKELKDFQKLMLKPGEVRKIQFTVNKDKLAFYDESLDYIKQAGEFSLMIGSSSTDIRLQTAFFLTE